MAGRKTYSELLRDPRWQRKRLEVMDRAGFACETCECKDKTLNVHHRLYRKGAMPWDYAPDELVCLCEDCHTEEHSQRELIQSALAGLSPHGQSYISEVLGYIEGKILMAEWADCHGEESDPVLIRDPEHGSGMADAVSVRAMVLLNLGAEKHNKGGLTRDDVIGLHCENNRRTRDGKD